MDDAALLVALGPTDTKGFAWANATFTERSLRATTCPLTCYVGTFVVMMLQCFLAGRILLGL